MATLARFGERLEFYAQGYAHAPLALRRYRREVVRLVAEVSFGTGGLAVIGGTAVIVIFMTAAIGVEVGLQGYSSLADIGAEALTGFISSYANTREAAPILAAIALTATVGAGFTAQLGSMRVAEEIDALEAMAVPPVPFLVTTRILAGTVALVPLYCMAMIGCFVATRLVVTLGFGQDGGTYDHYFRVFLVPADLLWSFVKAIAMALFVITVHCHRGFTARGGPVGVGEAVGRAVRTSLIGIMFVDLLLDLVIYGGPSSVHLTG